MLSIGINDESMDPKIFLPFFSFFYGFLLEEIFVGFLLEEIFVEFLPEEIFVEFLPEEILVGFFVDVVFPRRSSSFVDLRCRVNIYSAAPECRVRRK